MSLGGGSGIGRMLKVSPWGERRSMTYDHNTGAVTIKRETDISAVLDSNTERQNNGVHKGEDGDFWCAASVPLVVIDAWLKEYAAETGRLIVDPFGGDEEWDRWAFRRLDNSEFRKLRTGLFRIGDHGKR